MPPSTAKKEKLAKVAVQKQQKQAFEYSEKRKTGKSSGTITAEASFRGQLKKENR
jgi:hypothetical protein